MPGELSERTDDALRLQVARAWLAERKGTAGADAVYSTIYDLMLTAKSPRTRLKAASVLAAKIDPPLKPLDPEHDRPVHITIGIVVPAATDGGRGTGPEAQANGVAIRVRDAGRNGV